MTQAESSQANQPETRRARPVVVGVVTSDKMMKTITVAEDRLVPHAKYGKIVRRRTKYKADDPQSEAKLGDKVEIVQTRPLSKTKCWRLVRIIERAR